MSKKDEDKKVLEELTLVEAKRNVRKAIRVLAEVRLKEVWMDGEWVSAHGAKSFADIFAAENAAEVSKNIRKRAAQLVDMIFDIVWDGSIEDKPAAFENLFAEFIDVTAELFAQTDLSDPMVEDFKASVSANLSEVEEINLDEFSPATELVTLSEGELEVVAGIISDVQEGKISAERAPLFANVTMLEPGWGNEHDNHYYPKEMLGEFGDVFAGAKMYETDHDENNRSTANWVSTSTGLVGFSEDGGPTHRVFIHDGGFAERLRNLKRGNMLEKMECSILAGGMVEKKKFRDDDGREGRRVTSIEHVHAVDWVTRAGAKGRAVDLIETHTGGKPMSKDTKELVQNITEKVLAELGETSPENTDVTPAVIRENDEAVTPDEMQPEVSAEGGDGQGGKTPETPAEETIIDAGEIAAMVDQTNLHETTKTRLKAGKYKSLTELSGAVKVAVEETKAITGSGKPFAVGSEPEEIQEDGKGKKYVRHTQEELQENLARIDGQLGFSQPVNSGMEA